MPYDSCLGPQFAGKIVAYPTENGAFKSRKQLSKVPRLGPKAFEQAAGFLRISDAPDPLDRSGVHPESYPVVYQMAKDLSCTVEQLMENESYRGQVKLNSYVSEKIGLPTLIDIMDELARPGRDPRQEYVPFQFDDAVQKMEDLKVGMTLPGVVTNVAAFGAFVDIGVHQDGLVHISELADRFVRDPAEVVKVHQKVSVTVLSLDLDRKRISLSMRQEKPN